MWASLPSMRRLFGDYRAIAVCRAAEESVRTIGTWCEEEDVDAWFTPGGYLQVSAAPSQDGAWEEVARACEELGEDDALRLLSREEVHGRCASPRFRDGVLYPSGATVNPARLAVGLRAGLLERGVEIHEGSPVRGLRTGNGVVANTDRGEVRAAAAVLAIGAGGLRLRRLRNRLTVTSSHIVVTEPVPDVLEEIGWTGGSRSPTRER